MKRFIASILTTLMLVLGLSAQASALTTWTGNISTLPTTMNTQHFNIQYDVSSIQPDSFTAALYVSTNGGSSYGATPCETQDTNSDPSDVYGGSGTFSSCITSDGNYTFKVVFTRDGSADPAQSSTTSTLVDSSAPNPPSYAGKTVSGDTYTLTFTAPSNSDVTTVKIYASTATTYSADASTQVGSLTVSPNQTYSFSYTAPNSTTRYFSLQAFNVSGNGSTLVGDPGTVVNPVITINTGQATAASSTSSTGTGGQVLGATTPSSTSGQINAPGQSSKKTTSSNNNGRVLGTTTALAHPSSNKAWTITAASLIAALAIYVAIVARTGRNLLFKKRS